MENNVLTTRTLGFLDPYAEPKEIVLTIFQPTQDEHSEWKVVFQFSPPCRQKVMYARFDNLACALTAALTIASAYLQGTDLWGRLHWLGQTDCGLPDTRQRPASYQPPPLPPLELNPGNLKLFAMMMLPRPTETGEEDADKLLIFTPTPSSTSPCWTCGFTFDSTSDAALRYGRGDDFIEAFLDALTMARLVHETKLTQGFRANSKNEPGSSRLPYKIGRSYGLDPREQDAQAP